MAIEVKFTLNDADLDYFRAVMKKSQDNTHNLNESSILENAKKLSGDVKGSVPPFVSERLEKLEIMVAIIEDEEWQIPDEERAEMISALAYFSEPEDLVPDAIPVLGFLDDAIMIELVAKEFKDDIDAFEEFCVYREREEGRAGDNTITREEWLGAKRRDLHNRMRARRSSRRGGSSSFKSIF